MSRSVRSCAFLAAVLVGTSTLAACSSEAAPPVPPAPTLAASYTYTLGSSCGERALYGTFSLTVADGTVVAVEGLDAVGHRGAETLPLETFPTIEGLTARAASEGPAEVSYDPATDLLMAVTFDPVPRAVDDEECYAVSDYTPSS